MKKEKTLTASPVTGILSTIMNLNYLFYSVLLFGIFLRVYGLNWGAPHYSFHPDELALYYATQRISLENLNPHFFAYGSLPIYLLKLAQQLALFLPFKLSEYEAFFLAGRTLSALLGSATLLILYRMGKDFYSQKVGLWAAAFLAVTVFHIQLSHFLTVDIMLAFFTLLALYYEAHLIRQPAKIRYYLLAGLFTGLALATKFSALFLIGILFIAHLLALPPRKFFYLKSWGFLILAFFITGATALLVQPYALLDYPEFSRQIKEQSNLVRGVFLYPYTIQYEQTFPYFYHLRNLIKYAMGIPLGILVFVGTSYIGFITFKKWLQTLKKEIPGSTYQVLALLTWNSGMEPRDAFLRINSLILIWVTGYFLLTGGLHVKFLRYLIPIVPFLCLLVAIALVEWETHVRKKSDIPILSKGGFISLVGIGVFLFSTLYAGAFISIYGKENTRVTASKWIYANLPPGSHIFTEGPWDIALPLSINGLQPGMYQPVPLDLYHSDSDPKKLIDFSQKLSQADLIVVASQRIYGSVLRVPHKYPLTSKYYKLLFEGKLGFTLAETFTRYPTLWGLTFKDHFADESFSVYDHPKILLFRKTQPLSPSKIQTILTEATPVYDGFVLLDKMLAVENPKREWLFASTPEDFQESLSDLESFQSDETRNQGLEIGSESQVSNLKSQNFSSEDQVDELYSLLLWLLTIELLGLIFLPLTVLIFRNLPDGGYPLSKVLGILIPAYLTWSMVSWGGVTYSKTLILSMIGFCVLLSGYFTLTAWDFLRTFFSRYVRHFLINEAVFLLAFTGFLIFRAYNPDIFWSESSMDFSFINGILRSEKFPPPDPWLSGFTLNYYYFGHYLVATLTKLTDIPSQITYNLAFALIPAFVISQIFSLLFNLTQKYRWGFLGVLFSCLIGNLDGPVQLYDIARGKEAAFRFFRSAHEVIPYSVHEFPLWSFIFVDLHAHVLNMPVFLFILFVGLNLLFEKRKTLGWTYRTLPETSVGPLSLVMYAIGLGALITINSWDYPTGVIFLLLVALYQGYIQFKGSFYRSYRLLFKPISIILGVLVPLSILLYLPFYQNFHRAQMGLGFVGKVMTPLSSFFIFFGLFIFIILSYLLKTGSILSKNYKGFKWIFYSLGGFFLIGFGLSLLWDPSYLVTLVLLFLLTRVLLVFSRQIQSPADGFIFLCLLLGLLIPLGCEWVFVRDFYQGEPLKRTLTFFKFFEFDITEFNGEWRRMNNIFKFYLQAWFLLSIAATYLLVKIVDQASKAQSHGGQSPISGFLSSSYFPYSSIFNPQFSIQKASRFWWMSLWILLAGSLVFTVMGIYGRKYHDTYPRVPLPPTLNGLAYLKVKDPSEYRAITWLNEHVQGSPVILEATGADYLYEFARISSNTGLPTVLGWWSHVEQREHWGISNERRAPVEAIYNNPNMQDILKWLLKYDIAYIYVGNLERRTYSKEGLEKFERAKGIVKEVYRDGPVQIYQVINSPAILGQLTEGKQ